MIDSHLADLQKITQQQFALLCAEFPELKRRGLTLFLGPHYARSDSGILMLGLNPGQDKALPADYGLQPRNCLLGDPGDREAKEFVYWRNARRCFGASPELEKRMETATFSFCIPFRTPNFNVRRELREALERYSQPILQRICRDCRPRFVIAAGKTAAMLCTKLVPISVDEHVISAGRYGPWQWECRSARAEWGLIWLIQLPHFSRFHAKRGLRECGLWLERVLAERSAGSDQG